MTREEMLNLLRSVEFELIDPPSSWKDIGFTEREIWVNSKGYGYIMCDEPTRWWEGSGIEESKWNVIRTKLANDSIALADIEGTSLEDLLDEFGFDEGWDDLRDTLLGLLDLPKSPPQNLFCLQTIDGNQFFITEGTFKKAYERDWCDYEWDELSDEMLAEWINRLLNEKILSKSEESV